MDRDIRQEPFNNLVRVYLSRDKNPRRIATEILVKKTRLAAESLYSTLPWGSNRTDGIVSIDWEPALLPVPEPDRTYKIQYDADLCAKHGVDVEEIHKAVAAKMGRKANATKWSV